MNMAVLEKNKSRKHFSIVLPDIDMPLEQMLEQYGSWLLLDGNCEINLAAKSILGHLIDTVNGVVVDGRQRVPPRCKIDVFQAQAIEDMLCHAFQTENNKVKKWLKVAVMFYVEFKSEERIAEKLDISDFSVKRDKMLGVVRLSTRFKLKSRITGS